MAKINRLKVVLVEKEKSGKWLADQLGKSTCTVSKWCSNTTQPDLQTLDKIAKMLDVTPAQVTKLLSGKENLGLKTISKIESVLQMDLVSIPNYEHYYTMQSAMGAMYVNEE